MAEMERLYVDCLVIGGGVAGLRAAIEAARGGGSVLVLTKDVATESSSEYAQGGVAVALSDEDEVRIHYEDTIRAGDGLANEAAVRVLVEEGPERIQEMIEWGAEFDREGARLAFTLEAAHSRRRVLHAHGDSTGRELVRVLTAKARAHPNVSRLAHALVTDLVVHGGRCHGAYAIVGRALTAVLARAVVLATGGGGQLYSVTTNPQVATADGVAMAHRAGAALRDLEFVQFHPTSLYHPSAPHFLLSEALRGEGARLINALGEPFMAAYDERAELAPRDVVSRSIMIEMKRTNAAHVYLDLRHLDPAFVRRRFPRITATCATYGIDITREPVPVSPAAHYMMGGVETDLTGATTITGLFAAGETACTGLHGANRLASNSLLEGLVYGARAGAHATTVTPPRAEPPLAEPPTFHTIPAHDEIRSALRRTMWEDVGIVRTEGSLRAAIEAFEGWSYILDKPFFTRREIELRNMLDVSVLIARAALARKKSVGAHFRADT